MEESQGHPIIQNTATPVGENKVEPGTPTEEKSPLINAGDDLNNKAPVTYDKFFTENINAVVEEGLAKFGLDKSDENMKLVLKTIVNKFSEFVKSPDFRMQPNISDEKMAKTTVDNVAKRRGLNPDNLKDLKEIIQLLQGE